MKAKAKLLSSIHVARNNYHSGGLSSSGYNSLNYRRLVVLGMPRTNPELLFPRLTGTILSLLLRNQPRHWKRLEQRQSRV
jgi:hypothetical protein